MAAVTHADHRILFSETEYDDSSAHLSET
jgi:hypothetical protein